MITTYTPRTIQTSSELPRGAEFACAQQRISWQQVEWEVSSKQIVRMRPRLILKESFALSHGGRVMDCQVTDNPTVPQQPLTPSQAPGDPNTVAGQNLWPLCRALCVSANSTTQAAMPPDKRKEANRLQMNRSTQMTGQQCIRELWSIHTCSVRTETAEQIGEWITTS